MPYKLHKIKSIREIVKQQNHLYLCEYSGKLYRYVGVTGITSGTLDCYLVEIRYGCYCIKVDAYSQSNAPNHLELGAAQWEAISNYVLRRLI